MKGYKLLILTITAILVLSLTFAFVGCDFLSSIASELQSTLTNTDGDLFTTSNARGTSLSLSSDGLAITRAQLTEETPMGEQGTRTVLIYLCGTDLESSKDSGLAVADIKEMVSAASNPNLKVIIETGGAKRWSDSKISAKNITRFMVTSDGLTQLELLPQANMGSASTLADFLIWGVTNYPAEKIDVILWNHGSGSINGVCFDENYDYDSLSVQELDEAFLAAYSKMTDKFESVGFDACLMSTIEVANVLASYSNYMIASEESEAGSGWAYKAVMNALANDPTMSGADLGKVVADSAYKSLSQDSKKLYTMSVIDLSKIDAVIKALDKTAEDMTAYVTENSDSSLVKLIKQAENFGGNSRIEGYTNMVDLGDMMYRISQVIPSAENVIQAIDEAVVYSVEGTAELNATGIAIYYPLKVQGSQEVSIFTNICVSPHYLAYLDKTVFGTSASGNQGGHNWEQWLQNDFDFWSLVDSFSTYWNDIPESDNNTYNVIEPDHSDVTIQLVGDPYLDQNGTYTVKITGESLNYLVTVDYALFKQLSDGTKILIGSDVDVNLAYRNGVAIMTDQFQGKWTAINDGQLIALEVTEETETYALYSAPVYVNGERMTLKIKRLTDAHEYEVLGVYGGITESGAATKTMTNLENGDVITPVYYVYAEDGSISETKGEDYVVTQDGLILSEVALGDGDYEYCFIMTDTTGEAFYTESTVYTIKGNAIYYTSEKTDDIFDFGDIWNNFPNPFGFDFFDTHHGHFSSYSFNFDDIFSDFFQNEDVQESYQNEGVIVNDSNQSIENESVNHDS